VKGRFHHENFADPCSIKLGFRYYETNEPHDVQLERSWYIKKSRVSERFAVTLDGVPITGDTAEDLMLQVLPPEILGFFFFDAEKIGDLADWDNDDDYKLFSSVNELLGLRIVDQLIQDLDRVVVSDQKTSSSADLALLTKQLDELEGERGGILASLRNEKLAFSTANRSLERAKQKVAAMGGLFADKRKADERQRDLAKAACDAATEALRQESASYLPLLVAPNALRKLQSGIDVSEQLESLNAIDRAFRGAEADLLKRLSDANLESKSGSILSIFRDVLIPKPVALSEQTLDLTLTEASWMRTIVVSELPKLQRRINELLATYDANFEVFQTLDAKLASAPQGDAKVEAALQALHGCQREYFTTEASVEASRVALSDVDHRIADLTERIRKSRHEHFRNRRLAHREQLLERLITALPEYATNSRAAKEQKFAKLLDESLAKLWHKTDRVRNVEVDLGRRSIKLIGTRGEISKKDLSAAEKQLFAIAFIFALAKLSGRHLPFVIDTPLGRLDRAHRSKLITEFLPDVSHQVILFSTDTEIVGRLYQKAQPLIQSHFELAEHNEGVTEAVQLEIAL
jgi:DNA sulfur modification protein DndD